MVVVVVVAAAAAVEVAVPSLASPLAARPSSVGACTAAGSDWRSAAGTLLWLPPLLRLASMPQDRRVCWAWVDSLRLHAKNRCSGCDGAAVVDVLVVGEETGREVGGGDVVVAVGTAEVGIEVETAAAVAVADVAAVAVGDAAVVGGGRRDCIEAG